MAERTVRFYLVVDESEQPFQDALPFDDIRTAVNALSDDQAYVQLSGTVEVLGSPYEPPRGAGARREVPLLALDRINRSPGIRIERRRNYRPLELQSDETIAEPSFYSVFDRNVLGVMRNSGGAPSPAAFRDYINRTGLLGDQEIKLMSLVDKDAIRALADAENVTKFTFAVGTDVVDNVFNQAPTILSMVRAARQNLGSVELEITVKVKPVGADHESDRLRSEINNLVRSDAIEQLDKAEMGYRRVLDGRAAAFDLLGDSLITQTSVDLEEHTNQPTEPAASRALASAYDGMIEEINSALQSLFQ
ncbi:MAG TPA: hypothetical protein PJ998_10055 [Terrimesophilobacter sp.]|nr:hypothetical protein [Terrimesophilobacter sp.]